MVLEGGSREAAARAAGMDRQTLRDWVHRYNAEGLAGLHDRPRSGRKPRLTPEQEAELAAAVDQGPDPDRDGVVRWRRLDLRALIGWKRRFQPLRRPPARALGRQGAAPARLRPPVGTPQAPEGGRGGAGRLPASFPELVAGALPEHARGKPLEVWFQDG
jgi:transposase-like protein